MAVRKKVLCFCVVAMLCGCAYLDQLPLPPQPATPPVVVDPPPVESEVARAPWLVNPSTVQARYGHKEWCLWEAMRFSDDVLDAWITYIKSRGGNSAFMALSHTRAGISPYKSGFSGEFSDSKIAHYRSVVKRFNDAGITPMVGLFDDQPSFHKAKAEHPRYIAKMVESMRGLLVTLCTAMEPEEFWSPAYGDQVAQMLKANGVKRVFVHSTQERFLTEHVDGLLFEWGHPRGGNTLSPASMRARFADMIARHPGKEVWAWEWTWFEDNPITIQQADACIEAGCKGVGQ